MKFAFNKVCGAHIMLSSPLLQPKRILVLAAAIAFVAADECSCGALEEKVTSLQAEMDELRALVMQHKKILVRLVTL